MLWPNLKPLPGKSAFSQRFKLVQSFCLASSFPLKNRIFEGWTTRIKLLSTCFLWGLAWSQNYALRFYGNGTGDIDRVKIPVGLTSNPANVGGNLTIEFRLKATLSDNPQGSAAQDGPTDDWTLGHVIIDRDVFGPGDYGDYGISLAGGRIAFGVNNGVASYTIVSTTLVADGNWHTIAVTRTLTGEIALFVDGILNKQATTSVTGNIAYQVGRTTSWPNDPYLVLGAEKHDYDNTQYPSFRGLLDELRISDTVRYITSYTPASYLSDDAHTVALYHFDEGNGTTLVNTSGRSGSQLNGTLLIGGTPTGPVWELVSPSTSVSTLPISIQVYPNPCTDAVFVETAGVSLPIQAYRSDGQWMGCFSPGRISTAGWSIGWYYLRIGEQTLPLVKISP